MAVLFCLLAPARKRHARNLLQALSWSPDDLPFMFAGVRVPQTDSVTYRISSKTDSW